MLLFLVSLCSVLGSLGKSERQFENIPPAAIGVTPCNHDMRCSAFINNSQCAQGVCTCLENFVPHPDNNRLCLQVVENRWSPCEENAQCTRVFGQEAECKGHCVCRLGHHFVRNSCAPSRGLGDTCWQTSDCYLPNDGYRQKTVCDSTSHVCMCKEGFSPGTTGQSCTNMGTRLEEIWTTIIATGVLQILAIHVIN